MLIELSDGDDLVDNAAENTGRLQSNGRRSTLGAQTASQHVRATILVQQRSVVVRVRLESNQIIHCHSAKTYINRPTGVRVTVIDKGSRQKLCTDNTHSRLERTPTSEN